MWSCLSCVILNCTCMISFLALVSFNFVFWSLPALKTMDFPYTTVLVLVQQCSKLLKPQRQINCHWSSWGLVVRELPLHPEGCEFDNQNC